MKRRAVEVKVESGLPSKDGGGMNLGRQHHQRLPGTNADRIDGCHLPRVGSKAFELGVELTAAKPNNDGPGPVLMWQACHAWAI